VSELRHDLEATLRARQEVGHELEPQLVDRFVEKVEAQIEQRARELASRRKPEHHAVTPLVLGSFGLAIPLIAIAGGTGGVAGVIAVCIAIVLVNVLVIATRR